MGNNTTKEKAKKGYIWIDPDIENHNNRLYYKLLFIDNNINCTKFDNIDEALIHLNQKENNIFKKFSVVISGKLFTDFYYKLKNNYVLIILLLK